MNTVLTQVLKRFVSESWYFPQIRVVDAVEILIITFLFYQIILWIKNTKAWMLLRGILVVALFILVAAFFKNVYDFVDCTEFTSGHGNRSRDHFPA